MKIKHKVVKEFQYLSPDKKIFILKAGTILEEYNYKIKADIIPIDKDIIDNNPEFFEVIDWKAELLAFIKTNKLPTPAVLTKKLIPFIDEMVLSGMQKNTPTGTIVDESVVKELQRKEDDLNGREKRIKEKEDEIDIRIKRVEKREGEYKEDLKSLDKKEDNLREKYKEIIEKGLDLDDKIQDLNEKERNLDRTALESSKEIDGKYKKLQEKIDKDLKALSEREKDLEKKVKSLSKKEEDIAKIEVDIFEKAKSYDLLKEEVKNLESDMLSILDLTKDLTKHTDEPPHRIIEAHKIQINSLEFKVNELYDKFKKVSL
jgi:myosin heavy subunit